MKYIYILQSINFTNKFYTDLTSDLKRRISEHNQGKSIHTNKHVPWKLKTYIAFSDEQKAFEFERYLKTSSGRAFTKKRL
ncbi:GIY-YIG nuclease family protein [Candidatus Dependentiae bacterium]|nr:GIY-YIG nuclease family protein [Candidatus Dependentiae bacterium]